MRALSFSQPWLWAILYRGKRIENRSWPPPIEMIGVPFALHAAKSWDRDATSFMIDLDIPGPIPARQDLIASALVGIATIDRVVTSSKTLAEDQKRWFFETRGDGKQNYGWVLEDHVRIFENPIPATGRLGLWGLTADQERAVAEQTTRAA